MPSPRHQWCNQPVLVTGATGFIGSHLAERLAQAGSHVTAMGRDLTKVEHLRKFPNLRLERCDLLDQQGMWKLIRGHTVLFHLAGWMGQTQSIDDAHDLNVTATENLLHLAAINDVERVIYVSSIAAYGFPSNGVIDETTALDTEQDDPYGRTKALAEERGFELAEKLGVKFTVIRPGMVYGPSSPTWTLGALAKVQGRRPVIFGDGRGHAFPTFIDNLVDALLLAGTSPKAPGQAFNICDPEIPMSDFYDYFGRMVGRSSRVEAPAWTARMLRPINKMLDLGLPVTEERLRFFAMESSYPGDKAKALLGYEPRVLIEEGMRRTESWLRKEGHLTEA